MKSIQFYLFLKRFSKYCLFFLSWILFACSNDKKLELDSGIKVTAAKGISLPPEKLKPPKVYHLDRMPDPQTIEIPTTIGATYTIIDNADQEKKIELLPPEVKPAGINYLTQSYSSHQGLASDTVYGSAMDKMGNLWFATSEGVSKYDGKSFTNYNVTHGLVNNTVSSIFVDSKGNIWIGTSKGLNKYNGIFFTAYNDAQDLSISEVKSILEDKKGNIWFGTSKGLWRYNGEIFTSFTTTHGLPSNHIYSLALGKDGNLWIGTDGGASKYNGKSFVNYTSAQGLPSNHIFSVLADKKGYLWFGTDGGVSKYDGKSFVNFTTAQGLSNDHILSILEAKNGEMWFGTNGGGVCRYDGKSFKNYGKAEGLSSNYIRTILEDPIENMWFATEGGGVCRYDGDGFTYYTAAQGLANTYVRSILEDRFNNLWFGTNGGGVSKYDMKSFTNYSTHQGLPGTIVRGALADKKGNLWFGTVGGGLTKYDGKSFINYSTKQGLAGNDVRIIYEDSKNNLWIGTNDGGVSKYDGETLTNYTTDQGLPSNRIKVICEDKKGYLWFGTMDAGISQYDGKTFTNYSTQGGLPNNYIFDIMEDAAENLWLSTVGGGLFRYDGKSFLTYMTTQGLSDNTVFCTALTKQNEIAIGTDKGLSILTGYVEKQFLDPYGLISPKTPIQIPSQNLLSNEELKDYIPVFEIFNDKTGYPIKDFNGGENSMFRDSRGVLWFGTGLDAISLVRFDYSALHKNKKIPEVYIQGVKIGNQNICWYDLLRDVIPVETSKKKNLETVTPPYITEEALIFDRQLKYSERETMIQKFSDIKFSGITKFYYVPENLQVPHIHNNITIDFAAIEPDNPQVLLYQYKLEGYDRDWSLPSNKTSVTYGNIFEGFYQFKVRAKTTYSDWSEPTFYTFKIIPPWYRTWWAYILYTFISMSMIYTIYLWRRSVLQRLVEERTEELSLAHISLQSAKEVAEKANKVKSEFLASMSHQLRTPLSTIIGYSEMLMEDAEVANNTQNVKDLKKIMGSGRHLLSLINDVLDIAKIEGGKIDLYLEDVEVEDVVKDLVMMSAPLVEKNNNSFTTTVEPHLPVMHTDLVKIKQCLINLIGNASKFTKNGVVRLSIHKLIKDNKEWISFAISDTGIGMSPEGVGKLFKAFSQAEINTTRKFGGTGLGLFLTKKFTEMLGGEIVVESELGKGTTFTMILPQISQDNSSENF